VQGAYGVDRWNQWAKFLNELCDGRWRRAFYLRRAWLSGHRQQPFFDVLDPACELLAASRLDRRLQELGRALQKMAAYPDPLNSGPEQLKGWEATVPAVVKWGAGTPFPDLARYGLVACMAEQVRLEEAAGWVRTHLSEFDNPLRAAYCMLYLVDWEWSRIGDNPPHESLLRLAREALDIAPQGSSAVQALVYLADGSQRNGRDSEMVDLLQRALAIPRSGFQEFQDESAEFSRSRAGQMLARHYQKAKNWPKAIDAWKAWESHSWCVTCDWGMEEEKNLALGTAYEALGRVRDSAEFFWKAAAGRGSAAVETAKKVKAIHESLGNVPELIEKVRSEVKEESEDPPAGLKWLAENLGVPLK
ncbi:MAG TPA: hypothetical protein VFS19_04950, partial [Planctomycetota bacterium]|nr:hypothetical protein [Planctomycetota bacterium]